MLPEGALRQRLRSDFATALLHWVIVALFLVNLATALRIAGDSPAASWSRAPAGILPQATVYILPTWSAWAPGAASIGSTVFLLVPQPGPRVPTTATTTPPPP